MKKKKNISLRGLSLLCLGFLFIIFLFVFILKKDHEYFGHFFSAYYSEQNKQELGFFTAIFYYAGELLVGLVGFIPALFK